METPYAAQTPTQSSTAQDDKKPSGFNPEDNISIEQFEEAARKKYGIPKNLLQAMLQQESNGGQNLTSPTGVKGKYQVTQDVAEQWGKANGVSGADRNNPFHQAAAGMWYLRKNFDDTLDVPDTNARWLSAVGKYYGGPSAVKGGVADTISRDNVSNPAEHITRVGNYWKQLGLDGDSQEVPLQQQPAPKQEPAKEPSTEVDETTALLQAIGAQEAAAPVEPTVTPGVAAGDAYKKYIESGTSTGFDKDIAEASILFSKPGQEAAKGFDPDKKVVYRIDPSTFPVDVVAKSKDRQKEFVHQYFNRLGLQPKQTDELIQATGWKLFDPKSLDDNLNNYLNGVQATLPLDISAGTAALVDAYKSGGAEAARVVKGQLDAFKLRFEQSKHVITDEERKSYAPLAAKVGANVAKMLGLPIGDRTLDIARGMMAMKMGAYQTAKENIQFWNNITGGIAFPKLAQQMQEGFQKNYALQNQIEKSMTTGESFLQQGVATSGMLLRNVAAGALIAAATTVAASGAAVIAGTSGYNLFDTLISNLHESPEQRANAVVHQAILLGIPWGTKLGGSLLKGVLGKTASLTAGNIARASAAMKAAPLFSAAELGVATAGAAGYMGYSTKASGGTNEQAYAAALLGMALPVAMHMGSAAVNSIKGNVQQQAPLSQAQIDFNSLRPETQQHIIDMTAQGLRHPLVSNIIQTATAERAAQLGLNAEAVKMAFEAQEGLSERRLALGGLPVAIDPTLRNQYRKVLEINAGLWAEYSINGLGAIGIASMPGNSVQVAALRAPIVSTTHQINETIKQEFGNSLYDPDVPGVSLPVDAAQQIATKLLGNPDSSVQKFAADLQRNVDRAKAENYDRVGLVNVEAPGEFSGEAAVHENIHGQTGKLVEGPVRQKAKAQSAQTVADLDLTEKLAKDLGEHRGATVQQDIAKRVGNVVPIASEKPSSITVSGERFELNRGIKNTDVGDRILSGLLRNSVEAGKLKAKFRNAIESEGYYNDPEIAGMEEVYEPIARLTEQSFLKRHGISAKEAEALVISELASFNTDAQGIRQLADHLPLSQRNAFLDFLNDPSTRKYETQGTTKTTVTPPSTVDTNVPPEGRGGSEKSVPSTPAPTTKPAEGRPVDTEAGTRPATPEQTGTSAAKLETQRPSETGVRPEPKLSKPRKTPDIDVEPLAKTLEERSNTAKAEPEELRTRLRKLTQVASDPNAPQHVVDSAGRALARYGATREDLENLFRPPTEPQKAPEPAKTPVTDRFLDEYPQFKEKTPNEAVQEGITPEFNLDRSSVKTSQVQKTIENLERTFDGKAIPERTREYLRGAGVNVEKLERMLKGEAEPVVPKAAVPVSEPKPTKPISTESKPIKPGDVKVGDRVFDASSLRYGTVTKVGAKTVKLTLERRPEDEGTLPITTESQYSRIAWNRYGDPVPVPPRPQEAKPVSRGKIPAELVPELNSIRRQFQAGQIKPGDTITLSNGINVVAPRYENQFADVVGRKLAENSEAYGRTAQLIRAYWGRGNDNAVASIMDAFNLPGEPHTREAQDLVHRAVVKSFNNPKMSPEKVGALVQSEARVGKVPEEIGLSEIPSSDLYRWAKTRNLTEAFPPDIMSIGKDVASKRKGNTVSLYSRDASGSSGNLVKSAGNTAISRTKPSSAVQQLDDSGLIKGRTLHLGAGRQNNPDRAVLDSKSTDAVHFDPNFSPDTEHLIGHGDFDTVVSPYVLNVLPPSIRKEVILNAATSVKPDGKVFFAVRGAADINAEKKPTWKQHEDGYLIKNKGDENFQRGFTPEELVEQLSPYFAKTKIIQKGKSVMVEASEPRTGKLDVPSWDTKTPLYSRYGNGMNPKEAFQNKISALYTEKNYENIPVNKKNEVRQAFSKAQAAWSKGDAKAFQEETFKAVYKLDEIIGETKNTAQKLAEIGVTAVRLNPLINAPARLADFTGTNVNVQTQVGTNPLKRFVGYIAETYIVPKAVKDKNVKDKRSTKLLEAEPITKTIPKIHAEDWMKGTGAGVLEGAKDAYEILKTGGSTFQLQTGMSYNFDRSQTGWVGSDKAINRIAGAVGNAPDAVARRISFDIIVRQFAREHSLQFPKNQQKAEFNKFYKNVPEEIIGLATALTEKYTYNNPNAAAEMIHTYIDKFAADGSKAALHHAANLAYRYVRVPTNVASQAVRITGVTGPGMVAWDVYQLYRNLFKSYDTNTGKFGMTLAERRIAIEKLTESTIGAMLMSGVALGALTFGTDNKYLNAIKNNVAGSYDENDPKAGKREEIRQIEPGAVRVPGTDRTVRPGALGPYQRVAQFQKDVLKGTGYKGINEDEKLEASTAKDTVKSYGRAAANVAGTYPLVGGTKELMEGIFDDKGTDPARKIAESLTIGGAKDFGAYKDPIRRVTRKGSIWDNLKDNYGFGDDMPARVDSTGEPLKKRNIGSFFTKEYTTSPGIEEVDRLGLSFPNHKIIEKGNKLSVEEQAARAEYLGKLVKQAADKVVDSKEYKALASDEDKALVLNDTIQQINRNPDLTKDEAFHNARINAEFYKRREKLRTNSSYAKMTVSQQQAAEKYLKTQFNKYSVTSEKKENDKADTFDLYMDFSDFLTSDFADAVEVAIEKASEKPRLPYERKK